MKPSTNITGLQIVRCLLAAGMLGFVASATDLGTSPIILILATCVGIFAGGWVATRGSDVWRVIFFHILAYVVGRIVCSLIVSFTAGSAANPASDFATSRLLDHLELIGWCYIVPFAATWLFWTKSEALTAESLLIGAFFIWMLSGHRNYHLDAPKNITSLTWKLDMLQSYGIEPQHLFLIIAVLFSQIVILYLLLASSRQLFTKGAPILVEGKRSPFFRYIVFPIVVLLSLGVYALFVNRNYEQNMARAQNGVGQNNAEGQSPLGFNGAEGRTKQPAALVRLENDYPDNPTAPMLYFREGALSEFAGVEYVNAPITYDSDVPRIAVGQPFVALDSREQPFRTEVKQSVFLLTKHPNPFTLDYPRSIQLLKNPDPKKFLSAYQAVSIAPTIQLDQLIGEEVGDPSWSKELLEHYLRGPGTKSTKALNFTVKNVIPAPNADANQSSKTPETVEVERPVYSSYDPVLDENGEDLRYKALAEHLTKSYVSPVMKTSAIISYLGQNSIYTRSPGHKVTQGGDPVAPYLFADKKRGYCVHFAHAAVFMLRSIGIPARIGTGYLTDSTYAKDGHILLSLGDRHAWPEIFIRGRGWVVVDVTPAQAENEQVLVPNQELLEELMEKIDPAEALLTPPPPELAEKDNDFKVPPLAESIGKLLATLLILTIAFLKWCLYFGHWLPGDDRTRAQRAYRAFVARTTDLGYDRLKGETRHEFVSRLRQANQLIDGSQITAINERNFYGAERSSLSGRELNDILNEALLPYSRTLKGALWSIVARLRLRSLFRRR